MNGEVNKCPYCLQDMADKPINQRLTPRQYRVYEAVIQAGPEGVGADELLQVHLPDCKPTTLRTCIHAINIVINPRCLKGRGGRYYLDRVNWSEEKTTQEE